MINDDLYEESTQCLSDLETIQDELEDILKRYEESGQGALKHPIQFKKVKKAIRHIKDTVNILKGLADE